MADLEFREAVLADAIELESRDDALFDQQIFDGERSVPEPATMQKRQHFLVGESEIDELEQPTRRRVDRPVPEAGGRSQFENRRASFRLAALPIWTEPARHRRANPEAAISDTCSPVAMRC